MVKQSTALGRILKQARKSAGLTQAELSLACGYPYNIATGWENGWRKFNRRDWDAACAILEGHLGEPPTEAELKAELLTDEPAAMPVQRAPRQDEGMAKRLRYLRERGRKTLTEVARDMGEAGHAMFPSQVSRWESGNGLPTHAQMRALVQLYQTTYDYIYDGTSAEYSYPVLLARYNKLSAALGVLADPELVSTLAEARAIL